jgi:hypothetical protein
MALLHFAQELDAAHARHALVCHHHSRLESGQRRERFVGAERIVKAEGLAKREAERIEIVRLVVDNQDVVTAPLEVLHTG